MTFQFFPYLALFQSFIMWFRRRKGLDLILVCFNGVKLAQKTFGSIKNFHPDHFHYIKRHILGIPSRKVRDSSWV